MSWFRKIKLAFGASEESKIPIARTLDRTVELFNIPSLANKYMWYHHMWSVDPEIYSAVSKLAKLVRQSYQGVTLHPGKRLEPEEEEALRRAKVYADALNLDQLFHACARNLILYGDDVYLLQMNGRKITQLQSLPIRFLTIVEDEKQINDVAAQIFERNIYILNEGTHKQQIFKSEDIVHLSIDPIAEEVTDLKGRYTYGVWSISPLERLRHVCLWKWNTMLIDVLWKNRMVPREHHKLNLSMFSPEQYPGSMEEKVKAAQEAAKSVVTNYVEAIRNKMADQGFITDKDTEIEIIEPKSTKYSDPNLLLEQINEGIYATIGITESVARGRSKSTFATEIALNSINAMIAMDLARTIKNGLVPIIQRNLMAEGIKEEIAKSVDIKLQLVLTIDRGELVRQAAVMSAMGCFTDDEIRELLGYDPLTEEQRAKVVTKHKGGRTGDFAQTIEDIARDVIKRTDIVEPPITPESRRQKQET